MEELTKKELLDYLEEISQQLNNIALDQIPFAISELYFKLENSIPISVIEKEIEEIKKEQEKIRLDEDCVWNNRIYNLDIAKEILQELLDGKE